MAHTAPVDPQKQLHDFFGITAILERFDTLERKIGDLTRLVQGLSKGHAQRFDSLKPGWVPGGTSSTRSRPAR